MSQTPDTVFQRLTRLNDTFTRAERQLAGSLLENYPVSGLGSITNVARNANVSTPTVVRMMHKIGYSGFPDFQNALRQEVEAKISNPIAKHESWAAQAPDEHILNRFTKAATQNIRQSLAQIETRDFEAAADLLADDSRTTYIVGGRITRALADYFFLHMQVIRREVALIQSISNAWPHDLLNVETGDVLVVFDVRRYENATLKLAEMAKRKGARIILFTDQWQSPVSTFAELVFASRIEVPSAWDSAIVPMLFVETLLAAVQERTWDKTRDRMETLEEMFDETRFFRKFT